MKTLILSVLLIPSIAFSQWDYHAHFWGSATLSFGLHFKLDRPQTFKYPAMVLSLGLIKEATDYFTGGTPSWMDVRADATGTMLGFIVSDMWLRRKHTKNLNKYELDH